MRARSGENVIAAARPKIYDLVYQTPLKRVPVIPSDAGSDQLVWLGSATPGTDWASGVYYAKHRPGRASRPALDPVHAEQ
jgi:hypothetical protein